MFYNNEVLNEDTVSYPVSDNGGYKVIVGFDGFW